MSKLLVYLDGEQVGEQVLDHERITIGRKPNNDLQLAHSTVSGSHALAITIRNDSFLEDLNSTNGTKVNGKSIKKCLLRDGDEIGIAKYVLKYVFEALDLKHADAAHRHDKQRHLENLIQSADDTLATHEDMLQRAQTLSTAMQTLAAGSRGAAKAVVNGLPPEAGLQILSGVGAGREMDLNRTMTTLGKPGIQVSVIARSPAGYSLSHLEGANTPLLNGVAIDGHPHVLEDHDIIEIAGIKLEFYFKGYRAVSASERERSPASSG
ncbi:MAG: FHA domain-containing protein [Sulfuricella sp.]|nr:FHA domain-containing protein [Sulfuricella sp.]